VSKQLWIKVYRPYLSFLYLTNAYHFYSPNPGPPTLLWFAVQYSDGSYVWVKLPNRENSPIGMHYQRMLALPEHSFQPMPRLPLVAAELALVEDEETKREYAESGTWEEIYHRREIGSTWLYHPPPEAPTRKALPIPMVMDMDAMTQYRQPTTASRRVISSVAKRILWHHAPKREGTRAVSVKMYRLVHNILSPAELAKGISPLAKTKHMPYFLGEFDLEGRLKDPRDPFLYWYLPMVAVSADYPHHGLTIRPTVPAIAANIPTIPAVAVNLPEPKDGFLLDCLEMHAAGRVTKVEKK
jgi:hypothetical protein